MAQKKPSPPTLDPLLTHYTDGQVATIKAAMTGFDDPAAALHSVAGIAMGLLYSVPETVMEPSNVRDRQEVKRDLVRKTKHLLQVVRELQEAMEEFPDELIEKLNAQFSGYPADPDGWGPNDLWGYAEQIASDMEKYCAAVLCVSQVPGVVQRPVRPDIPEAVALLATVWRRQTGAVPGRSVDSVTHKPGGPFYRFVEAILGPIAHRLKHPGAFDAAIRTALAATKPGKPRKVDGKTGDK